MPLLEAPADITAADLRELLGLDLPPEYVLVYFPPQAWKWIWDRLVKQGRWELLTIAQLESGSYTASDDWILDAPRTASVEELAAWVRGRLRHPVTLDEDTARIRLGYKYAQPLEVPVYWVRRNS